MTRHTKKKERHLNQHTFGKSQAAINLISGILAKEEYKEFESKIIRLLSKQSEALNSVMHIPNEHVRNYSLDMWHRHFATLVTEFPEIVRTHILCVETGWYRQSLKDSKKMASNRYYSGFTNYAQREKREPKPQPQTDGQGSGGNGGKTGIAIAEPEIPKEKPTPKKSTRKRRSREK